MRPRAHRCAFGLIALLIATGCTDSGGSGWGESPAPGTTPTTAEAGRTSLPATSGGEEPADPIATTTLPAPVSSAGEGTPPRPIFCPAGSGPACEANSAAGAAYLAARVTGGTYGFRVVRVGEGVLASLNPEHAFYPASSVKVLAHLHAVRWVAGQPDPAEALAIPVPVYEDQCAGEGSFWTEPLATVLAAMMIDSDNRRADAILDYFGREEINRTAVETLGLSDTVLAHPFGCGGPANEPPNRSTALDLSRIYEQVAGIGLLGDEATDIFTRLMLGPIWPSLADVVAAVGEDHGLGREQVEAWREKIELSYKAGWWGTHLSVGGLLTLPGGADGDGPPRQYAFAVFVDGADAVAAGFDVGEVVAVVLRAEVGAALLEAVEAPGGS